MTVVFHYVLWYKGNQITMDIEPGNVFIVHYNFPTGQRRFSKYELSKGSTMSIPEAECTFIIPPMSMNRTVTLGYKVSYLIDLRRVYLKIVQVNIVLIISSKICYVQF